MPPGIRAFSLCAFRVLNELCRENRHPSLGLKSGGRSERAAQEKQFVQRKGASAAERSPRRLHASHAPGFVDVYVVGCGAAHGAEAWMEHILSPAGH